jgi:hypothetical protein
MSEPSKEALSLARELLRSGLPPASNYTTTHAREEALASVIDREFAALRAKAEAADGLADEITRLRDCVGEIDAAISDGVLAAYEQAKEGK